MRSRKIAAALALACAGVLAGGRSGAQVADKAGGAVSGIPVNYTEAKAGTYQLPDPLKLSNGQPVPDAKTWAEQRRPEILKLFQTEIYGAVPATAPKVAWAVTETVPDALDGTAVKKHVVGRMGGPDGKAVEIDLYTPSKATKPVPVLVNLTFRFGGARPGAAGGSATPATAPTPARGATAAGPRRGSPAELISRGYGYAAINYSDFETDTSGQPNVNLARKLGLAAGQTAPAADEWGAIAAWAWGMSRFIDFLETEPSVDAKRIAITGVSRLGKTVLWEGASDPRVALVIASCSGEGGAALARRNYGETVAHMAAPTRYHYQFAGNYAKYKEDPGKMPVDTHMLVALMAPRPLLLQTGNTDHWSDPKGEFLAAVAATAVYKLLGKRGIDGDEFPPAGKVVGHELSYIMHDGGHGTVPSDWDAYLKFMDTHLKP